MTVSFAPLVANMTDDERRWKEEFQRYEERVERWSYNYDKYLRSMETPEEKRLHCP